MTLPQEQLYEIHVSHLRTIRGAFDKTHRQLRSLISKQDASAALSLLRLTILLTGIWAEVRLQKLLFEPDSLTQSQRDLINRERSQTAKWLTTVELGFRVRYNLPRAKLSDHLPITPRGLYREIVSLIENELRPLIETRNDLAHGQWENPLTGTNNVSDLRKSRLDAENALTVKFKLSILDSLGRMIHDLICSPAAFDRDIDRHHRQIETAKRNLANRDYLSWERHQIAQYQRGLVKRREKSLDRPLEV